MLDSLGTIPTIGLGCLAVIVGASIFAWVVSEPLETLAGIFYVACLLGLLAIPLGLAAAGYGYFFAWRPDLTRFGLQATGYGTLAALGSFVLAVVANEIHDARRRARMPRD